MTDGMGGHHRTVGQSDEWYTPPEVFEALGLRFDLDPCAPPGGVEWIPAERHYSAEDDGLTQPWAGRVWLNPPYGPHTSRWIRRLAAHGDGIALVFARTDTAWFHEVVPAAAAVCFIRGRLDFVHQDPERMAGPGRTNRNAGAPSLLIGYGAACGDAIAAAGLGMTFAVRSQPLLGQGSLWEGHGRDPELEPAIAARAPLGQDSNRGEGWCECCGQEYPTPWYAPSALWNEVVGSPNGMLCPNCFIAAANALLGGLIWRVDVDGARC